MAMNRKMIYTAGLPLMILSLIFVCCAFALPWATAIYDKGGIYIAHKWYGGSFKYTTEYEWEEYDLEESESETLADEGMIGTASIISIASMAMLLIVYLVLSIVLCKNKSEEKVGTGVVKGFSVLLLVFSFALLVGVVIWIPEFDSSDSDLSDYELSSCASGCALGMTAAVLTFLYGIMLAGATCCMKEAGYDESAPAGSNAVVVN